MQKLQSLIHDLNSSNSSIRDRAALELMDIRDGSAVGPLLQAIAKPENVNHRGTLVYALSSFNCEPFLEVLVDLVLTGNFEVSTGAFGILESSVTSAESIERVRDRMQKHNAGNLVAEHHLMAFEALQEITASNDSTSSWE
ncbi:MAG: hypothetical protein V4805_12105 [Pseudomonadota bacterium]